MPLQLTFLGTGTSSTVPAISCLIDEENGCKACRSTLPGVSYPGIDGKKNIRRNTSGLLQVINEGQQTTKNILLDAGKSFYQSALDHFPSKGFKQLDAVFISHPHADAMNGLDDLRSWTLGGAVQKTIDVYCDQATFHAVQRAFPYLTSVDSATGGGDVPALRWHIIDHDRPFDLFGVTITPLPVYHGFAQVKNQLEPFYNLGYMFDQDLIWISDVSEIPNSTWEKIEKKLHITAEGTIEQRAENMSLADASKPRIRLPVLVIDCLKLVPHASHFGIGQLLSTVARIQPHNTYIFGFAHRRTHDCWVHCCKQLASIPYNPIPKQQPLWPGGHKDTMHQELLLRSEVEEDFDKWAEVAQYEVSGWLDEDQERGKQFWLRPAFDGLTVKVNSYSQGAPVEDGWYC